MARISDTLVSDVAKERSNTFLLANQYDDNSRKYKLVFTNNGVPIPFDTPKTIRIIMKAKGEAEPYINKILTEPWENNQPVMIFTAGMLSKVGEVEYKFIIYEPNGTEVLSTRIQRMKIQETFTDRDGIIQDEDFDFLTQLINEAIAAGADILRKSELVNGATQTVVGVSALDAAFGKTLYDSLYFKGTTTNLTDEINKALTGNTFTHNYGASTTGAPSTLPGNVITYYLTTTNVLQCGVDSDGNYFYRKRTGATISDWVNRSELSSITGVDTSGILGTTGATVSSQELIDGISDRVATKLLPIANVVNTNTTTLAGRALDARQANPNETGSLAQQIFQLDTKIENYSITNALYHGVKGDGVTDDTSAIQALLDSDVSSIYFPEGNYLVSGLAIPAKNIGIIGDINGKTIFKASANDVNIFTCDQLFQETIIRYENLSFDSNGFTSCCAFKLTRILTNYFNNIRFINMANGFDIDRSRECVIRNVYQIGVCANKIYSTNIVGHEFNWNLIVDGYNTAIYSGAAPTNPLFELNACVNTQWSNIINMGLLQTICFDIYGLNEGVFISKSVIVTPTIGVRCRESDGNIPNCIHLSDVSIDQYYTAGVLIKAKWFKMNNCAVVNGSQRSATDSAIIIQDGSSEIDFSNVLSYNNNYAAFNIGNAQRVSLNNCTTYNSGIISGYDYICTTQTLSNPLLANCRFEDYTANGLIINNGRINNTLTKKFYEVLTATTSESTIIDYTIPQNAISTASRIRLTSGGIIKSGITVNVYINNKNVGTFSSLAGNFMLELNLLLSPTGYLTKTAFIQTNTTMSMNDELFGTNLNIKLTLSATSTITEALTSHGIEVEVC